MSEKKLKPEHRKLWRRVYFYEFEELRHTAEDSANMADKVVAQWEARGAFDEVERVTTPPTEERPISDTQRLRRIRAALENKTPIFIDGVEAGVATQWEIKNDLLSSDLRLTYTVEASFSFLSLNTDPR